MKIAEYNQMMAYLTRPEPLPQPKPEELLDLQEQKRKDRLRKTMEEIGPGLMDESVDFIERENFSKAGVAKVIDYVNSLPDGTEVSTKDIRQFIEKNNVDANPTSISNIISGSAPGKERFKDTIKFVEQLGSVKYNEDTFKKIDELLEDPKITSFRNLGEELGYKTPKPSGKRGVTVGGGTPLSRQSPVIKAYVKSRGGDPFEVFKVGAYKRGQPKVEQTLKLQADGMSTNSIADKLFKGNRTNVRRIFRLFRPEAIKDPTPKSDDPTTTTKTRASARRQKREAEAFKKVGEKTAAQTKKVINTIKDKNADILKMSDAEILNDPKIRALRVLGQPSVAAGFAVDEARKGNIKTAGASLLAPELVGSLAPAGRGILSTIGRVAANPFGKAARAFTPVGLATIGAGALKDVYDEYERRQALTDEERLAEDLERDEAADEMMVGAAEGGRIGFADGPDDPSKRKFMKLMGIMSLLPFGIGKGFKMAEKAAPVVAEGAKLGYDNFLQLMIKIKAFGKEDPTRTTLERQKATTYTGKDGSEYELIEDMSTGDMRITRDKSGVGVSGDKTYDTIEDRSTFELKVGQADETTKGKKPPDEYEEGKAVFDQDGTIADIDDVDDATIKAIEDEIN
jgi:hypothetical protein